MMSRIRFLFVTILSRFRSDKKPDTGSEGVWSDGIGFVKENVYVIMSNVFILSLVPLFGSDVCSLLKYLSYESLF